MPLKPPSFKKITRAIGDVAESVVGTAADVAGGFVRSELSALETGGKLVTKGLEYADKTKDLPVSFPQAAYVNAKSLLAGKGFSNDYTSFRDVGTAGGNIVRPIPVVGNMLASGVEQAVDPLSLAGGAYSGTGLAANILGRGTLTLPRYTATIFGGAAAARGAQDLGLPPAVVLGAGLLGGGLAGAESTVRKPLVTRSTDDVLRTVTRDPSWDAARRQSASAAGRQMNIVPGALDSFEDPAVRALLGLDRGASLSADDILSMRMGDTLDAGDYTVIARGGKFDVLDAGDTIIDSFDDRGDLVAKLEDLGVTFKENVQSNTLRQALSTEDLGSAAASVDVMEGAGYTDVDQATAAGLTGYAELSDTRLTAAHRTANNAIYERATVVDAAVRGEAISGPEQIKLQKEALGRNLDLEVGESYKTPRYTVFRNTRNEWQVDTVGPRGSTEYFDSAGAAADYMFIGPGSVPDATRAQQLLLDAITNERRIRELMVQRGLLSAQGGGTSALDQVERNLRILGEDFNTPGGAAGIIGDNSTQSAIRGDFVLHDALKESAVRRNGFKLARDVETKSFLRKLNALIKQYVPEYDGQTLEIESLLDHRDYGAADEMADLLLTAVHDALRATDAGMGAFGGGTTGLHFGLPNPFRSRPGQPAQGIVAPMRDLATVADEATIGGNWLTKMLIGHSGVNRNVLLDPTNPISKQVVGMASLSMEGEFLTAVAIRGGWQPVARTRKFGVFSRDVFQLDVDHNLTVSSKANPSVRAKVPFNEVAEHPQDFNLNKDQLKALRRGQQIVDETYRYLDSMGMAPIRRDMPEGRVYFPRQVEEIRGIDLEKASSAWERRRYETFIDAYANGIDVTDPTNALGLHVLSAYRHVAMAQFEAALAPYAVKPSALIPTAVNDRAALAARSYGTSLVNERNAKMAAHDARIRAAALKQGVTQRVLDLEDAAKQTAEATKLARRDLEVAKKARQASLADARKSSVSTAWKFGGGEETIPIKLWHDQFYRKEYVDAIEAGFEKFQGPTGVPGVIFDSLNFQRMTSTGFDFAAPWTHGAGLIGRDPVGWAVATVRHYAAFFDPTMVARDMERNIGDYQWMAQHELMPTFTEIYEIRESGGFTLKFLDKAPGGKGKGVRRTLRQAGEQTYGRTGAAMELALLGYRRAMLSAMRPGWTGSESQLAETIRLHTGAVNTRNLSISGGQRVLESMFLGLSPRLLRSTVGMVAQLRYGPFDPRARAAAYSLTTMMGAIAGMYYTVGMIAGKDDDEILQGLNPLNGKRFLSYKIGDEWYGIGGQFRALSQMLGGFYAAAAPEFHLQTGTFLGDLGAGTEKPVQDLWALDSDNPVFQFWLTRSAPGVALSAAVGEAASGGKTNLVPFNHIDNGIDLAKHLLRNSLPFAAAGLFEENRWERDNISGTIASFLGLRTSPATPSELRNDFLNGEALPLLQDAGIVPADVTSVEALGDGEYQAARRYLRDNRPDLLAEWEAYRRDQNSVYQRIQDERTAVDAEYKPKFDALYTALLNGTIDPEEVRGLLKSVRDQHYGETKRLYSDPEYRKAIAELLPNELRKISDDWWGIIDTVAGDKGFLTSDDWAAVEIKQQQFLQQLEPTMRARFEKNLELRDSVVEAHPILKLKREADAMSEAYYDLATDGDRTAYLKLNPDVNIARWLVYGGKLYSTQAVDDALAKRATGETGKALATATRDVLYANFSRPINDAPELWNDAKAAIDWYFNTVVPLGKQASVLKRRGDLNGVLAFYGYGVQLHSTSAKTTLSNLVTEFTDWGRTGEWAKYGPAIMWWMNLSTKEREGDKAKNKPGAITTRPDVDAAYAYYRNVMFGVPPVLYTTAARPFYAQYSGESTVIPVRTS